VVQKEKNLVALLVYHNSCSAFFYYEMKTTVLLNNRTSVAGQSSLLFTYSKLDANISLCQHCLLVTIFIFFFYYKGC